MLKFVAVGTGRCGTRYVSKVITDAGMPCGHESIFNIDGIFYSQCFVGDSSWLAVPYLHMLDDNTKIIHIVRNPLNVFRSWFFDHNTILSLSNEIVPNKYSEYILKYYPKVGQQVTAVDRAVIYYIECNTRIKNISENKNFDYFRYRVEDDPKNMLDFLGASNKVDYAKHVNSNTRNKFIANELDALKELKKSRYYDILVPIMLEYYPELGALYEF